MKYLERADLPRALRAALVGSDETYMEGLRKYFHTVKESFDFAISVTTMPGPPRIRELERRYSEEIITDPEDNLWSLKGSMIHDIIEANAQDGEIAEKRVGFTISVDDPIHPGKKVRIHMHGQLDLYDKKSHTLDDFKYANPRSMMYPTKPEYIFQLNALAQLMLKSKGIRPDKLRNVFILKDWSMSDYMREKGRGYPEKTIIVKDQPWIPGKQIRSAMIGFSLAHYAAKFDEDSDDLPYCTPEQQWRKPASYKLYKRTKAGHMSVKACFTGESEKECKKFQLTELSDFKDEDVEMKEIKSKPTRCIGYCPVASVCNQRKEEIEQGSK